MTAIRIRPLNSADLALGIRLKTEAGWNQTEADWRRALDLQPDGCFVAELTEAGQEPRGAGTIATCVFGDVAWIALVLVDAAVRGQGIGRALMQHALTWLDARGVPTVRLDATPLGQPLYESLGFELDFSLARYEGRPHRSHLAPRDAATARQFDYLVEPMHTNDVSAILDLDRAITQTDRSKLIQSLIAANPTEVRIARRNGRVIGFSTSRPGSRATHLGPILALEGAGDALLAEALERHADQPIFIDIPDANRPAIEQTLAQGLTVQRPLMRMSRGRKIAERAEDIWASFGPEKG